MKKILTITTCSFLPFLLHAQKPDELQEIIRRDYIAVLPVMVFGIIIMIVVLKFTKIILNHRLKQKMVDKGVSDKIIESFLKPAASDVKNQAFRWFIMLTFVSIGLFAVSMTLPVGVHSLAIMVTCIAAGFLVYYLTLKEPGK